MDAPRLDSRHAIIFCHDPSSDRPTQIQNQKILNRVFGEESVLFQSFSEYVILNKDTWKAPASKKLCEILDTLAKSFSAMAKDSRPPFDIVLIAQGEAAGIVQLALKRFSYKDAVIVYNLGGDTLLPNNLSSRVMNYFLPRPLSKDDTVSKCIAISKETTKGTPFNAAIMSVACRVINFDGNPQHDGAALFHPDFSTTLKQLEMYCQQYTVEVLNASLGRDDSALSIKPYEGTLRTFLTMC